MRMDDVHLLRFHVYHSTTPGTTTGLFPAHCQVLMYQLPRVIITQTISGSDNVITSVSVNFQSRKSYNDFKGSVSTGLPKLSYSATLCVGSGSQLSWDFGIFGDFFSRSYLEHWITKRLQRLTHYCKKIKSRLQVEKKKNDEYMTINFKRAM